MAQRFVGEIYSLRQAADAISQRYFDGHQLPFLAVEADVAQLVENLEKLVDWYNEDFANEVGQETDSAPEGLESANAHNFIDIATLQNPVAPAARQYTAFLVDITKAEVLDAIWGKTRPRWNCWTGILNSHSLVIE